MGCGSSSAKYAVQEDKKPAPPAVVVERDLRPIQKDEVERVIKEAQALDVAPSFEVVPLTSEAWSATTRADEALKAAVEQLDRLLAPYDPAQPAALRVCNIGERDPGSKAPSQNSSWDACIAAQDALMADPNDEANQWAYSEAVADLAKALGDEYYAQHRADARRDAILTSQALAHRRKHLLLECLKDPSASTHVRNRVLEALCTLPKSAGVLEALEEMNNEKEKSDAAGSAGTVVFVIESPMNEERAKFIPRICEEFGYNLLSVAELHEGTVQGGPEGFPTEALLDLVAEKMTALGSEKPIVIDGFPRSQNDLIAWDAKYGVSVTIDFCIFFAFPLSALSSAVTPEEVEAARERYDKFQAVSAPLIRQFAEASMLVDIDTSYPDAQIWKEVSTAFRDGVQEAQVLAMQRDGPTEDDVEATGLLNE